METRQSPYVSIVVPTFREVENLPVLVPEIATALASVPWTWEVVVVDDNSSDGTEEACAKLAATYPLRLIVRTTERGLSSAVLEGMRQSKGAVLLVMDADLSHPPAKIPELVAALESPGTDFVVGSRYVKGATTEEAWGVFRWINSKVATLLARPLTRVADPMAGFFALRRTTFEGAETLNPVGYKIALELMVKCGCTSVREVPIHFADRKRGQSKLTLAEQWKYLRHLRRLYGYRVRRMIRRRAATTS